MQAGHDRRAGVFAAQLSERPLAPEQPQGICDLGPQSGFEAQVEILRARVRLDTALAAEVLASRALAAGKDPAAEVLAAGTALAAGKAPAAGVLAGFLAQCTQQSYRHSSGFACPSR